MANVNIGLIRRISQVFFFLLLVYGGYLYLKPLNTDALPFVQNNPDVAKVSMLNAPQGYTEVLDTYMPFRTCRYVDGNRIFRACSVHFLTEVPVYGVPWTFFIPHMLVILLVSFLLARFACGWICPLGAVSDFLGILRKWLRLERLQIPAKMMAIIKTLRAIWIAALALLAVAIALPFIGLAAFRNELFLISCQTCPARNIFVLLSGIRPEGFSFDNPVTAVFSIIGILFLILVSLGFFGKRIWCRFCPNGLMLSWFNRGSPMVKEKDIRKCTKCGICKRVCPMDNKNVYEEKKNKNVNSADCIQCFTCVGKCPEEKCLTVKYAGLRLFESSPEKKANPQLRDASGKAVFGNLKARKRQVRKVSKRFKKFRL